MQSRYICSNIKVYFIVTEPVHTSTMTRSFRMYSTSVISSSHTASCWSRWRLLSNSWLSTISVQWFSRWKDTGVSTGGRPRVSKSGILGSPSLLYVFEQFCQLFLFILQLRSQNLQNVETDWLQNIQYYIVQSAAFFLNFNQDSEGTSPQLYFRCCRNCSRWPMREGFISLLILSWISQWIIRLCCTGCPFYLESWD